MVAYVAVFHNRFALAQMAEQHEAVVASLRIYMDLCQQKPSEALVFFQTIGEWDRYFLARAAETVSFELLGQPMKSGHSSWRLVDKGSDRLRLAESVSKEPPAPPSKEFTI
mmetsp:Transcript_35646/g.90834  ORF Transcript_35646/g.90834 Transcript_35646/m.90834 type:complete len:111 (-) Transcript_35646:67-399(-)